jgi:RNAse (barnase) inhibitor barstar
MSAEHYENLFADSSQAGVHHLPHGPIDDLLAGARAAGCLVLRVDLAAARNKDEMLTAVGRALRFPEWFGHNWDALTDCLLDMGWLPATGYMVILDHCDGIHGHAEGDFVKLMQVFQEAAATWREDEVPFWCLVDMQADGIAWLPTVAQPGR